MKRSQTLVFLTAVPGLLVSLPLSAAAYFGPGGVVSGVGALLALVAALVVSVFGFVWFPIKRIVQRARGGEADGAERVAE